MRIVRASPPEIAAAARLNMVAAVAQDTCSVLEKVGASPKYSLKAALKRWTGDANDALASTPSMASRPMPASDSATLAACAASARTLLPGTRPTLDSPAPIIAVLPRIVGALPSQSSLSDDMRRLSRKLRG